MLATQIKKTARVFGIEISRARSTRGSIAEHCAHAAAVGFRPATIIDVGAADGTPGLYEEFREASILLIDPLEENVPALERICRELRSASYTTAAAGAAPGAIDIMADPGNLTGSSCMIDPRSGGAPRRVPMITLDEECARRGFHGPYLIKIDTQGFELEVLRGASCILAETEVGIREISCFRFFTP